MRKNRKAERERMAAVRAAAEDEMVRFNQALRKGAHAYIEPAQGGRDAVVYVDSEWWYHCVPANREGSSSYLDQRSWCGCNDSTWADLLKQAGVERNPRWKDR